MVNCRLMNVVFNDVFRLLHQETLFGNILDIANVSFLLRCQWVVNEEDVAIASACHYTSDSSFMATAI